MALRIRCPHCRRTLVVRDESAGGRIACPSCRKELDVPLPTPGRVPSGRDVASRCPRCGHSVAPGTTYCPRCHTELASGRRLPLGRRIRLISLSAWTWTLAIVIAAGLGAFAGYNVYRDRFQKPPERSGAASATDARSSMELVEVANGLLEARTRAERVARVGRLAQLGAAALPDVARGLERSLDKPGSPNRRRNQRAALRVLGHSADRQWLSLLEQCGRRAGLKSEALLARGMLGDVDAEVRLVGGWSEDLRRRMLVEGLARVAPPESDALAAAIAQRARVAHARWVNVLRRLQRGGDSRAVALAADSYWDAWSWLGQQRDETFAARLFELAQHLPSVGGAEPDNAANIRTARDALARAAELGSPSARAAAGLVLAQRAPQYQSARQRIVATLASILPSCQPREQQRLTWALATLRGRAFGEITEESHPVEVRRADVQAALEWARSSEVADPGPLRSPRSAYPRTPVLTRRVVTPARQLESDLLRRLARGWPSFDEALDRWRAGNLGCTPRVLELLDPRQRAPNYPALAAAMILVAEHNEQGARRKLELWQQSADQPAWVRGLAHTALGALDARSGRWSSAWPAALESGALRRLGRSRPAWKHFGAVVAAGGAPMLARLRTAPAPSLSAALRDKLLGAARQAAGRRSAPNRP